MFKDLLKKFYAALLATALIVSFTACSDEDDPSTPPKDEATSLVEYLEANGDYINTNAPALIVAADLRADLLAKPEKIKVIDVRAKGDYDTLGHIAEAVNVPIADLINAFATMNPKPETYEKVVVACYTGQSAGYAVSVLRLLGYNNVYSLKWGMSSWNASLAKSWNNTVASGNSKASQFVKTETAKAAAGSLPSLTTGKTTGKEILEARAAALLTEGYSKAVLSADAVFQDLNKYYIINYWPKAQYDDPGHIPGAIQYTPKADLKLAAALKTLPTDKTIVVYCYTGQTSAQVAAYLRMLGYDAKTLSFGASGMIYDLIKDKTGFSTWKATEANDFPLVKSN